MKICHFSDWHGQFRMLPKADIYVCTGDMLPNFPIIRFEVNKWRRDGVVDWDPNAHLLGGEKQPQPDGGTYAGRMVDPIREAGMQRGWLTLEGRKGGLRRWLANPSAPVVCVRGNHDFTDLAPGFEGGPVWEVEEDPSRTTEILGLRIGGTRGINYIVGEWSDEFLDEGQTGPQRDRQFGLTKPPAGLWKDMVDRLPTDLDILITHTPPNGVLDTYGAHLGSRALRRYVDRQEYEEGRLRMHCFGHIHERPGSMKPGRVLFSNAATGHASYDLDTGQVSFKR